MCERYRLDENFLKLMDDGDGRCLMCLGVAERNKTSRTRQVLE